MFNSLKGLPRTVWLIGLISFLNDSASEMIYPLMPLYLASVLMAGPKALGLIEGIAEATSSLLKLFSGVLVDKSHRTKRWIVFGYSLAAIGRPLIILANSWLWVLVIRFTDRIGKGLRSSPRDALLAANAPLNKRGLVYGIHRALDNAGAVLGPLLAAGLLSMQIPLKDIFLWAIIPGVLTVTLSLGLKDVHQPLPEMAPKFSWTMNEMPTRFKRYLLAVGLFTLGCSSDMFLLLRAKDLGVSSSDVAFLWAGVNLIAALFSIPLSSLSDRWGRRRVLLMGWSAYIIFYIAMGLMPSASIWLFIIFAGYGLFKAATEGVEKALVADLAPEGLTGTAFGWFNLISGVMLFPASFIFGWLYEAHSSLVAFSFSAGCSLLALIVLYFWVYRPPRRITIGL